MLKTEARGPRHYARGSSAMLLVQNAALQSISLRDTLTLLSLLNGHKVRRA